MTEKEQELNANYSRKFVMAFITLVLCLVSVCGSTLALFTSNPGDGKIGINATSGQIDVDITDSHGVSLVGSYLAFAATDGHTEIIFEPGCSYRTQEFFIANKGSIPVNYRLYISNDGDFDMGAFTDGFDILICPASEDITKATVVTEFTGSLDRDATAGPYYLVVRMHSDADNKFSEQEYEGIGITLFAVQGNVSVTEQN